jgi:malonyl-CoA O-methyltransferase
MSHSLHNIELHPETGPPTLFLPGWGFDGSILRLCKPLPPWIYPQTPLDPATIEQDLLEFLAAERIRKIRLVGWSMGAMLGLEFAAAHRELIDSLVLVSLRPHWPEQEINKIRAEFSLNPETFLKGFYRKCFLGDRQTYRNFCATLEPLYLASVNANNKRLQRGLDFLAAFMIPHPLPDIPTRLVHGRQDIIAPVQEMATLAGAEVEVIDNAGHGVLLHEDSFLHQEVKKQVIREKFSRAANSYDSYAKVQTEVALKLAAKLPPVSKKKEIRTILEIGCGTGNFTALLAARFPGAKIVALDFSPEMIAKARHKLGKNNIDFICAEGEGFLGAAPGKSFELVVSNGSLQWFTDIDKALHDIARILTPGGSMSCSIFGPESLQELGQGLTAIQTLPESLAAQKFPQPERLQRALDRHFNEGTVEEELLAKEYRSAHDLLLHIKKTGTSGWQPTMQQPLTPARVSRLDAWFVNNLGSCRVTYQVFFLQGNN